MNLKRRLRRVWYDWSCRGILKTAPVVGDPESSTVLVSQLYHPDLIMYLMAVKSFTRHVRVREFVIVDDGLTGRDRRILHQHLRPLRLLPSAEVDVGRCPRGGCWERLLTLSAENADAYVVQLDADTLTVSRPDEVIAAIGSGTTFTLGTQTGTHFVSLAEASAVAEARDSEHVQILAERALVRYPGAEGLRYVRGCAGFTGFAPGQLSREHIEAFSSTLAGLIGGENWAAWGSEQVTSNFMAANAPDSQVLPVDRYPFFDVRADPARAALIHFFGSVRYDRGVYLNESRRLVGLLDRERG